MNVQTATALPVARATGDGFKRVFYEQSHARARHLNIHFVEDERCFAIRPIR